jgi:hypothetical protein
MSEVLGTNISLRHALATLAYRGCRAFRGAAAGFGDFKSGPTTKTPVEILAHIGDLLDWALSNANGNQTWNNAQPRPWDQEIERFYAALGALDDRLARPESIECPSERLFQGPLADALTHVGQISMLRRLAGSPAGGENFYIADIVEGRVGPQQAKPLREFD